MLIVNANNYSDNEKNAPHQFSSSPLNTIKHFTSIPYKVFTYPAAKASAKVYILRRRQMVELSFL